jgi:hypothetical protein
MLAVSITAATALIPKSALAQLPSPEVLPIAKVKGWELTLDGRVSAFASFSHGPPAPKGYPNWQGFDDRPDSSGKATATRIRSGFVSNYMGWTVRKEVGTDTFLSTRFALWTNISQKRDKTLEPDVDFREVYLKVDAPWGSVLAGRAMGLFGRGGIDLDYDIEHGFGLGSPCMIVNREPSQGPIGACGHVGFGILFPGFNAQLTYATPNFSGFQASVGLFDPAAVVQSSYTRTPLPRVEAELAYKAPKFFHASVSGSWQKLGNQDNVTQTVDSIGIAGAMGLTFGPLQLGAAGFAGKGLGIWAALEDYPVFSSGSPTYIIRAQKGILGMAALNFGHTKIAGGVGETFVSKVAGEPAVFAPNEGINFPKSQFGVSAGIYQGLLENLVLGVDFFSATTTWNDAQSPDNASIVESPKQTMNFVNVGATVVF